MANPEIKERIARSLQIGVIGGSLHHLPKELSLRQKILEEAEEVGREIARAGAILITDGMDGIMEASCKGTFEEGGITVGTPSRERGSPTNLLK